MGGGDYNIYLLNPIGGVEVVKMVEMMEIVPKNKYTRHLPISSALHTTHKHVMYGEYRILESYAIIQLIVLGISWGV